MCERMKTMQKTTEGLVLRATKTGEADQILSILTPEGIVSAAAKGSLRLKNKLFSACGLFCYSEFTLFEGKTMYSVDEASVKNVFFGLHQDITAMALACVMALGLAACGGTSSSTGTSADSAAPASSTGTAAEPCDLVVAWWGSQGRNEKFQSALDLYAEQNPGVTIERQTNGFRDHLTALSAAAASNDMPDMAMLQGAYYQQYVDGDLLVDLTPYVESGALDLSNVSEEILAATTIDGKLYGICAGMNAPSLIYNKTLLDEAGITIEDNMNLDQFAEKCAEIYEKTGYRRRAADLFGPA